MKAYDDRRCECPGMQGLSLVELLVAMLLGVILSGAMVIAYLGAKQNSFYDMQMARMQENGRYAMRLLSRELSMAGFFAGAPTIDGILPAAVGLDCSDRTWVLDGSYPLELVSDHSGQSVPVSTGLTPLTCLDGADIVLGTDLLTLKRTASEASLRRGQAAEGVTSSTVESWYLRLVSGEPKTWEKMATADLLDPFNVDPSESYWKAVTRIFFIRRYSDAEDPNDEIPTLCMETLAGDGMTSRCLVEGVENMQFDFGIDTDGDGVPNLYKSSPTADELQHAVVAKIHLLLRSINQVSGLKDAKTYTLGQKVITARHDSYLRRVFSSTVLLRNQTKPLG